MRHTEAFRRLTLIRLDQCECRTGDSICRERLGKRLVMSRDIHSSATLSPTEPRAFPLGPEHRPRSGAGKTPEGSR